ncbi:hypothetical protein L249_1000, partial [Ophiocordyceps polyrhachis-furcata BCC 54312]
LHFGGSARHSHTHTQGTRPEGLGGSRDAGPAAAGPRPPRRLRLRLWHGYAVQRLRPYGPYGPYEGRNVGRRLRLRLWHGYAVQRLRPYGPYGPYEGRNPIKAIAAAAAAAAADPEGLFDYRLLRGGEDEGPALADLETFFLPIAGELTADSTLFFFDLSGSYGYSKRPRCYSSSTASSFPLKRSLRPDFFGCFFRPLVFRPFLPSLFFLRPALRPIATTGTGSGSGSGSGSGLAAEYGYGPGIAVIIAVTIAVITAVITGTTAADDRTYGRTVPTPPTVVTFVFVFVFFFFSSGVFRRPFLRYLLLRLFLPTALPPPYDLFKEGEFSSSSINSRKKSRIEESISYLSSSPPPAYGKYRSLRKTYLSRQQRQPSYGTTEHLIRSLEKHAFLCRKIGSSYGPGPGPGPGPDESIEHSYGLFQALPKEIQV